MFDPEEFVEQCRSAVDEVEPALAVREAIARALAQPGAVARALPDVGIGGQVTWFRSAVLTVQALVWPPGLAAPPHEHRMWAVVGVVAGQEDNQLWRRTPGGIERAGHRELRGGEVLVLGSETVHAVSNPRSQATVGIHVYGGDILAQPRSEWDHDGRGEHPFDLERVRALIALLSHQAEEAGRALTFDEIRHASLVHYLPAGTS